MGLQYIKKRDGQKVTFKPTKIEGAIEKALVSSGEDDEALIKELADKVINALREFDPDYVITVEDIQDQIEKTLMDDSHQKTARNFILYRQKRSEERKIKHNILGKLDDSDLSVNGLLIAKSRYLQSDEEIETPNEMFLRVAKAIASVEKEQQKRFEEPFYESMINLEFVPGGRILANAGTKENMLCSSFVLPIKDSMRSAFKTLYHKAIIQRLGGGTGFSFSRLRQKGRKISGNKGFAAGPVAFIKLFDHASELTLHKGNRKAANMGSLNVEHPDIIEFITMKDRKEVKNFNISVEITDAFMQAVKNNTKYEVKDPDNNEVVDIIDANNIFHLIVTMAWKTGDPGVLFIDRINESNPLPHVGEIETTDPCGDQLLLPYEAGNLGAINLKKFVKNKKIQWKKIEETTAIAVRFLDNVIDAGEYPFKKIEKMAKGGRRIGLGIMGFADMLYKLHVPYNSEKALEIAEKIMKHISSVALKTSQDLAKEKGVFEFWDRSVFFKQFELRNCSLMAISPTGSRSIFADTSPGIEPNFALGYIRKVFGSSEIVQLNPVLEQILKENNLYSEDTVRSIIRLNSVDHLEIHEELKKVFVTAHNISPQWHIRMQAAFQKHIDNAISKTINFPRTATIEDIKQAFLDAYDSGCKGLTVYRDGSLQDEIIRIGG